MTDSKIPEPFSSIIDDICDQDRKFFEANPLATSYVRPYRPGEFYPHLPNEADVDHVVVTNLEKGVRVRAPEYRGFRV